MFVAGAMGSGTSLTALLLGQSFDCAALIPESARQIRSSSPLHVDRTETYGTVERYRAAIAPDPGWTAELVRSELLSLYRGHADRPGDVVIDKGPNTNMTRAALLAAAFPDARFVFVFRDPVANVEGMRRKWRNFGDDPLDRSIAFYRELHEDFLAWADRGGASLEVVEYERLVEDPGAAVARLGGALGLVRAAVPRRLEDSDDGPDGRGIRHVRGSRIDVVRGATEGAYARSSASDVDAIRAATAPLYDRMRRLAAASAAAGA